MNTSRGRAPLAPSDDSINLNEVSQTLPASAPTTRSLSKSSLRDPSQKQPPPPRAQVIDRAEDDISVQPSLKTTDNATESTEDPPLLPNEAVSVKARLCLDGLPEEVQEIIMTYIAGQLNSSAATKAWAWRHPRRKDVSDLALVSRLWRNMVQERIFRHVKMQGTQPALAELSDFFSGRPHLQDHVRHLQVIVPLWETKPRPELAQQETDDSAMLYREGSIFRVINGEALYQAVGMDRQADISNAFRTSTKRAALAEIFATARVLFPNLHALTIESAHCKNPPQILYFRPEVRNLVPSQPCKQGLRIPSPPGPHLPVIPTVKTLILRGAWNIFRNNAELDLIHSAFPSLESINYSYHTPKTVPYITMCHSLRPSNFPSTLRHLTLCLEGLYAKHPDSLTKWKKVYPAHHICRTLGSLLPRLDSFSYTGRLCGSLFSESLKQATRLHRDQIRTKRIDIVVRNVCRDPRELHDGTGIHNMRFISTFESIVAQAMRTLLHYQRVNYLRIRFIDLDSPDGPLNPAFHLEGDEAWGFWSENVGEAFAKARPRGILLQPCMGFGGAGGCEGDECGNSVAAFEKCKLVGKRTIGVDYYRGLFNNLTTQF